MSIAAVSSYLTTKVKAIPGIDARYVFEYEAPGLSGFPWITITMKEWKNKWLTNSQNQMSYVFTIRIYQEIAKQNEGPKNAEANLRNLSDLIIAGFNSDNKLGNTSAYSLPVSGKTGFDQSRPIRIYEIEIECEDIETATG